MVCCCLLLSSKWCRRHRRSARVEPCCCIRIKLARSVVGRIYTQLCTRNEGERRRNSSFVCCEGASPVFVASCSEIRSKRGSQEIPALLPRLGNPLKVQNVFIIKNIPACLGCRSPRINPPPPPPAAGRRRRRRPPSDTFILILIG